MVDLTDPQRQRRLLEITDVSEIWGVGRKISEQLNELGIHNGLQLADSDPKWIRQHFSVVLERTVLELNGIACIPFDDAPPTKKQIVVSRSFGNRIVSIRDMHEAMSNFVSRAAEKLRYKGVLAKNIQVFMRTSPFAKNIPQHSNSSSESLIMATSDTRTLLNVARRLTERIWTSGFQFAKAGVMLSDFYSPDQDQQSLFEEPEESERSSALMSVIDKINKEGKHVRFAHKNKGSTWDMKRELLSPRYTTSWLEPPIVK